ncbi:MAG: hypothetical protein QW461_08345 [Candidatus Jordarchaeales archaeon]
MKWRTHIAIAKTVADVLGLGREARRALITGSIEPDKRPDVKFRVSGRGAYAVRISHHNPSLRLIMGHVWKARRSYLEEREHEALRNLGRALHYVQDMSVSKGILGLHHDSREDRVASLEVPVGAVREGVAAAVSSPHYVEKVIRQLRPQGDARVALDVACRASGAVAAAVLSRREPPEELMEDFASARRRYLKVTVPLSFAVSLLFLVSALATQNPTLVLGVLSGYFVQLLDRKYHYLRKEVKWYGK